MAITISGENNNDKILASDGVIDQISGFSIVGVVTATSFTGDLTGNVTGNLTGNVNSTSPLLLQTGGSERFRITGNNELGIAGANYGSSGQVLTSGGSGSAVSWTTIPTQVTIANNADNRVITGGSGVNLNGESNLTFDGSLLTVSGNLILHSGGATRTLQMGPSSAGIEYNVNGTTTIQGRTDAYPLAFKTQSVERLRITSGGNISIFKDLDVDGHTNLDNVSIAGVTTFTGNANFGSNGSITGAANFSLSSNKLRVTGSDTVGIECQRAGNATIQCTDTSNSTDLQLRANASGGLVRTATNKALNLGTFQKNRIQITNDGKVQIGLPGGSNSLPSAVDSVSIRARDEGNLHIRDIGNLTSPPSGSGVGIDVLNNASNTVKDLCVRGANIILRNASAETLRITSGGGVTVKSGGQLRVEDSGNNTANSTHTTGAFLCNLIRSDTGNNNAYNGTYFMNRNAAGGGRKAVGILETGLKVGDFTSNLAAAETIKLTHDGHVEIKTDGGRLKIGAGNDLQMYHDNGGGTNHITCVNNHHLKLSAQSTQFYDYTGVTQYLRVQSGDDRVRVYGESAVDGTSSGADGFSIATGGGTSCPLYFGTETDVAQKSMYLKGYWIYLRGHVNEGMKFIFSQGGAAPHGNIYEFKYNSAKRPGNSTTWDNFSDSRAKENVQSITNGIEKIKQLRPVTFDWTDDYADSTGMWKMDKSDPKEYNWVSKKENGYDTDAKNGQYGFLAQEYETVLPKDVKKEKFKLGDAEISDFRTLNHDSLIATLTAALKESIAKIETLETKVAALESS